MTRDEAIEVLKAIIPKDSRGNGKVLNTLAITKAILMGIEALQKQPRFLIHEDGKMEQINPQQKTGHWIEHKHGGIEHIECSKCHVWFLRGHLTRNTYCPECGSYNGGEKNE